MGRFINVCLLLLGLVGVARTTKFYTPQADRLPVNLYYETLCPYCKEFVTKQLDYSMFLRERLQHSDLTLVPYGNAVIDANGNVECQHGVDECELNAWHACILEHHDIYISLKLISCMMQNKHNSLDFCSSPMNINVTDVKNCKNTRKTSDILKKYAEETAKVKFSGVPAVFINNERPENATEDFDKAFCDAYLKKFNKLLYKC
ncbi:GILT-like protein 2 [Drosophila eugracilis]|uniref:GILT-like protein 2 n=1 Tax=Drosophila eugracilis TaxID=29029 RepID=UPI0007E84EB4|nr:GILT-like protein 2 [Drosophila eugracilis]